MKDTAAEEPPRAQLAANGPGYNPVFQELVDKADHRLVGLVAYGLYKLAKREWVLNHIERYGLPPSQNDHDAYARGQTNTVLDGYRAQASETVTTFADTIIEKQTPAILADALKGNFWAGVWQSLVASLIFAFVLAAIVIVAAISGVGLPIQINLGAPQHPEVGPESPG